MAEKNRASRRKTARRKTETPQILQSGWLEPSPKWTGLLSSSPLVVIVYITVQAGWSPLYVCALILLLIAAPALQARQSRSV